MKEERTGASIADSLPYMIWGQAINQAVYIVARLRIADLLESGPKTAEVLAERTGVDPVYLGRVLRALTGFDVFREDEDRRFHIGSMGERLTSSHPQSLRAMAEMNSSPFLWGAWGRMFDAVKNGAPAFDQLHGESLFDYLARSPEDAALFNEAMSSRSLPEGTKLLEEYDFGSATRVIDVGGGHGALLKTILEAHPHLTGVLADLEVVLDGADIIRESAVADRCELVVTDFFEEVPAGGDLYLLKEILHDWNDEQCLTILRNCRKAMREGGRVVHIGAVLGPSNVPDMGKWTDLTMLTFLPGRERTEAEFEALYQAAGFEMTMVLRIAGNWGIVEGTAT